LTPSTSRIEFHIALADAGEVAALAKGPWRGSKLAGEVDAEPAAEDEAA
jgi:hypothetical protein